MRGTGIVIVSADSRTTCLKSATLQPQPYLKSAPSILIEEYAQTHTHKPTNFLNTNTKSCELKYPNKFETVTLELKLYTKF